VGMSSAWKRTGGSEAVSTRPDVTAGRAPLITSKGDSMNRVLAEGCSAYRFGERVMVKRLWTDSLGRACVDYTQYAHGVRNECSETLDVLRHSPRCASAFCPTRAETDAAEWKRRLIRR
jgi:hypothetical protein